jgi:hypothetical protein
MPRACRGFAVVFFVFGLALISGNAAHAQEESGIYSVLRARPAAIPRWCGDRPPILDTKRERTSVLGKFYSENLCDEPVSRRTVASSTWPADVRGDVNEDPVLEELKSMGEKGLIIGRAREDVIRILKGHGQCAEWFAKADPDAAEKFRSLRYAINEDGPQLTLKIQNAAGEWLYEQPVVANSIENAGRGSTIAINGRGAFFRLAAGVRIVPKDGGPGGLAVSQTLRIDFYSGGTTGAQVTALLHEFSHVVGLLPADGESFMGAEVSTQNTQIVLRHCRAEVEAAAKHKSARGSLEAEELLHGKP